MASTPYTQAVPLTNITDNMTADILTKALPQWKVVCHSLGLSMRHSSGGVLEFEGDEGCMQRPGTRDTPKVHSS